MWEVEIDNHTILYTGDYNDEEGSYIPPCQIPSRFLKPGQLDMLIMECTYGNVDFQSVEERRKTLIQAIVKTIQNGGKVLIPCHGIGYTQELLTLMSRVWDEHQFTVRFCSIVNPRPRSIILRTIQRLSFLCTMFFRSGQHMQFRRCPIASNSSARSTQTPPTPSSSSPRSRTCSPASPAASSPQSRETRGT